MMDYREYLKSKELVFKPVGFRTELSDLNPSLFPFQKSIVQWALRIGRAALFEDCGMGKTIQQLEWASKVFQKTKKPVLILAPLAVSAQTKEIGAEFGYSVNICSSFEDVVAGINITNYQKLHKFKSNVFSGIVLDESSILKNFSGKIRKQIIEMFSRTDYRLACTATPSPNDYMELGNHSEFLGVMTYNEMLSMFFVNDSGNTGTWRLKKHANENKFWQWLSSWAVMASNPSDLGFVQKGFDLPKLHYKETILPAPATNLLFAKTAKTLNERRKVRTETIEDRCKAAAELVNNSEDQFLIWCGLNAESELLTKLISNSVEITGSTDFEAREKYMLGFAAGKVQRLITKPSIAGFGMNWQSCSQMVFVGLNDSWEQLYQAIRRVWRFGQKNQVTVHIIIEEREGAVLQNIKRKDKQAAHMIHQMVVHTKQFTQNALKNNNSEARQTMKMKLPSWIKQKN